MTRVKMTLVLNTAQLTNNGLHPLRMRNPLPVLTTDVLHTCYKHKGMHDLTYTYNNSVDCMSDLGW